eukprot:CAMPEP_0115014732 /NCGR_PEP_ID=MMETSP0216-20121206/26277_1 /TAXON_ID=223996 /ORGANISM="Protocruzia adherens, Strain Boccale" /LENGTH=785 /DNA_ID=CAMNT_0002384575 /DNA_START=167 /DNA_END=2524 /DNA_ORIENTATION=-
MSYQEFREEVEMPGLGGAGASKADGTQYVLVFKNTIEGKIPKKLLDNQKVSLSQAEKHLLDCFFIEKSLREFNGAKTKGGPAFDKFKLEPVYKLRIREKIDEELRRATEYQSGERIDKAKLEHLMYSISIWVLQEFAGLQVSPFLSRDRDEVFVKVKASEANLKIIAVQREYDLQLVKKHVREEIKHEFMDWPLYSTLELDQDERVNQDREKYFIHYRSDGRAVPSRTAAGDGSLFRYVDKVRLISAQVANYLNVAHLTQNRLFLRQFPLEYKENLNIISSTVGNFKKFANLTQTDIENVRNYFGEKIALYFVFIQYCLTWLAIPAIAGVIFYIWIEYLVESAETELARLHEIEISEYIELGFATFIILYFVAFVRTWEKKERTLAQKWGMLSWEEEEPQRPAFYGEFVPNPISGVLERKYSKSSRKVKVIIGYLITFSFIGCTIFTVALLFQLKAQMSHDNPGTYVARVAGMLTGIQIKVFNFIYKIIANALNNWENHETETQYEDAMISKLFMFQFINSYASLFYLAFFKGSLEGCPEGCITELSKQLITVFLTLVAFNVVELGMPLVMSWLKEGSEKKSLQKLQVENPELNFRTTMGKIETQSKKEDYGSTMADYLEIAVMLGFVFLFCTANTLLPLFALLALFIEVKVDAYKLCSIHARPFPAGAEDIGFWNFTLRFLAIAAIFTNVGLIIFGGSSFSDWDTPSKVYAFVIYEQVVIFLSAIINKSISIHTSNMEMAAKWNESVKKEYFFKVEDEHLKTDRISPQINADDCPSDDEGKARV